MQAMLERNRMADPGGSQARLEEALAAINAPREATISQGSILDHPLISGIGEGLREMTGMTSSKRLADRWDQLQSPLLRPQTPFGWADFAAGGLADIGQMALAAADMGPLAGAAAPFAKQMLRSQRGSIGRWESEGGSVVDNILSNQQKMTASTSQTPPGGQSGVQSRLASPFDNSIDPGSPYVKEIISNPKPIIEQVPVEVQLNRFGKGTKVFDVVIQPSVLAKRADNPAPIKIETWQQARALNFNEERLAGWNEIYSKARKIEDFAGSGGFRRDPAKKGKLVGIEVGKLTEGCQRAATTVERVRHGLLPKETRIEACYGGDCWANETIASMFGGFENMENRPLALATPQAIEKWFTGSAAAKRVSKLNEASFIRMGYAGDDSHAIATGIAQKWLEESAKAGVKKKTVFISSGYAPVSDDMYRSLAQHKDKFEIHFSVSGWFDQNEIMMRFGEFMAAKEAGIPAKMRIITNADNISDLKMVNEQFLDDLLKKNNIQQHEILETPYHDDALRKNNHSAPSGKYKFICCETGACKTCGVKCMTKVAPGSAAVGLGSVATTDMLTGENE